MTRLPAVLELLEDTAAAFAETGVAKLAVSHEHLAARGIDGLGDLGGRLARHALVALAVVIGADIEIDVVLAVVPLYTLVLGLGAGTVFLAGGLDFAVLVDLRQQPRARDDSVGLEQLQRGVGAHLGRDYAEQIILNGQDVDDGEFAVLDDELCRA